MKYIDADLLIRKIKGQIRLEKLNFAALGGGGQTFCINTLEWVLKQIDSLQQEQPEVDLEKEVDITTEIEEHARNMPHCEFSHYTEDEEDEEGAKKEFRYFYELGRNTRKEE